MILLWLPEIFLAQLYPKFVELQRGHQPQSPLSRNQHQWLLAKVSKELQMQSTFVGCGEVPVYKLVHKRSLSYRDVTSAVHFCK